MSIFSDAPEVAGEFTKLYRNPAGSATLIAAAAARKLASEYGVKVSSMALGQPDGLPPVPSGVDNKYGPVRGQPKLRKTIAEFESKVRGVDIAADDIHLTNGGKQALENLFTIKLDKGDKFISADNKWVSYAEMLKDRGANNVIIDTHGTGLFTPDQFAKTLKDNPNAKAALINSPSNPTGNMYSKAEREAIMRIALEHRKNHPHFMLIVDDIYKTIGLEGEFITKTPFENQYLKAGTHETALMKDGGVAYVDGVAKAFKLMGERVGYVIASPAVIKRVDARQSNTTSGISNSAQDVALKNVQHALKRPKLFIQQNKTFRKRRDYIVPALRKLPGINIAGNPSGAFYAFTDASGMYGWKIPEKITDASGTKLNVSYTDGVAKREGDTLYLPETITSGKNLSDYLLYVAHVATVAQDQDYVRFSYPLEIPQLKKNVSNMKKAINQLIQREQTPQQPSKTSITAAESTKNQGKTRS